MVVSREFSYKGIETLFEVLVYLFNGGQVSAGSRLKRNHRRLEESRKTRKAAKNPRRVTEGTECITENTEETP
jgi:hypothetical protein